MRLEELAPVHEAAFLEMLEDYRSRDPAFFAAYYQRKTWNAQQFQAFAKECARQRMDWRPGPGKTAVTRYVLIEKDGAICGNGVMRFPLDEEMENHGGNLLFDVPPAKRQQGYGALTLNKMLFEAVRAGLSRVLVSCPAGHVAARKCIEKNRGELEREPDEFARYWIRFR